MNALRGLSFELKAMFKFVHKDGPLVASSHLYDHKVLLGWISLEACDA